MGFFDVKDGGWKIVLNGLEFRFVKEWFIIVFYYEVYEGIDIILVGFFSFMFYYDFFF